LSFVLHSDHAIPGKDFDRFDSWHFTNELPVAGFAQHPAQCPNGAIPAVVRFVKFRGLNIIRRDLIHPHSAQHGLQNQTTTVLVIVLGFLLKRSFVEPFQELFGET
jgi:hypothetical protein